MCDLSLSIFFFIVVLIFIFLMCVDVEHPFYVFICHLNIVFGKVSIQLFCLISMYFFLLFELNIKNSLFWIQALIRYIFCKYDIFLTAFQKARVV